MRDFFKHMWQSSIVRVSYHIPLIHGMTLELAPIRELPVGVSCNERMTLSQILENIHLSRKYSISHDSTLNVEEERKTENRATADGRPFTKSNNHGTQTSKNRQGRKRYYRWGRWWSDRRASVWASILRRRIRVSLGAQTFYAGAGADWVDHGGRGRCVLDCWEPCLLMPYFVAICSFTFDCLSVVCMHYEIKWSLTEFTIISFLFVYQLLSFCHF